MVAENTLSDAADLVVHADAVLHSKVVLFAEAADVSTAALITADVEAIWSIRKLSLRILLPRSSTRLLSSWVMLYLLLSQKRLPTQLSTRLTLITRTQKWSSIQILLFPRLTIPASVNT